VTEGRNSPVRAIREQRIDLGFLGHFNIIAKLVPQIRKAKVMPPARASLCYGPSDRSAAQGCLRRRAPTQPVTRPCRLPASGPIDSYPGETLPH
jgi:hypothetical protein